MVDNTKTSIDKPYGGRIEDWELEERGAGSVVLGFIHDDPRRRFDENYFIHTSLLVKVDLDNKKIETLNTVYDLGVGKHKVQI